VNETVVRRTCVDEVWCDSDDGGPLRIAPVFETPRATRMRISVGAMPCVNWERTGLQRILGLPWVRNTHVDLHSNHSDDALRGVPDGEEDDENELHGKIEHAALDNDIDGSLACPCRELRAMHVTRLARREIPDTRSDEACHYHVRAQWKREGGET
jgi:hypothetical protein